MQDIKYGRKRSGIIKEIRAKIEDWLETIEDEQLKENASKDVIITGGCIASMLLGEKINDFDVYFRTLETTKQVAEYYVKKFNEKKQLEVSDGVTPYEPIVKVEQKKNIKGEYENRVIIYLKSAGVASETQSTYSYFELMDQGAAETFAESLIDDKLNDEGEKYRPIFISENAITLSHKFQLVTRFHGEPYQIHNNYDFIHATSYYDYHNKFLEIPAAAMESLLSRTLIYKGSLYPIASIFRMKKFLERGWRITAGQQLKIMWQISELNLSDPEIIKEQLIGVDQAYMWQLTEALKSVDLEKINSAYVSSIIDKIFD